MKKVIAPTEENRYGLKRRMLAALSMLLVAVILSVLVSYAWIILSVAPELRGISTTIGANGSLEVALLDKNTFSDPNAVKTVIGSSLSNNRLEANNTWGNMVDLTDPNYGLQEIVLYPSRLNIQGTPGNYTVNRNGSMLLVPIYGADGRIMELTDKTVTGTYSKGGFYNRASAEYGVRAIGTANAISVQSSALAQAKGNIPTFTASAISSAKSSVSGVQGVQDMLLKFAAGGDSFTIEDIDVLKAMIERLQTSEDYIEDSIRQGLVAMAASVVKNEAQFGLVRTALLSDAKISALLSNETWTNVGYTVPEGFMTWVNAQESMENNLTAAMSKCNALDPAITTKADIREVLNYLMNLDYVLVGDKYFSSMTREELMGSAAGGNIELTLKPGSGVYATIADFAGNYSASLGSLVTMKTVSAGPAYLSVLSKAVSTLKAAEGDSGSADVLLEDIFGYVVDLAFRSNAYRSSLLLQTDASQRVYGDSESGATMGGGSYMEFTIAGDMDFDRTTRLMDAVRVAFVDDAGNLLGIAKPNITNRVVDDETGNIKVPLYLYDFEIGTGEENEGHLLMGERRKTNNAITSLERDMAKAVSTLVWLDGDIVDNTVVSAETNLSGKLNLQFASSVDLVPAENNDLYGYITNKDGLADAIAAVREEYIDKGQTHYTTASWMDLVDAYDYAVNVNSNSYTTDLQVYNSILALNEAKSNLQELNVASLDLAISHARAWMGKTDEEGCLVSGYDDNGLPILLYEYTEQQKDNGHGFIDAVDANANLFSDGSRKYTSGSWDNWAQALYYAEAVKANPTSSAAHWDYAITQLELAEENLNFATYYTAYEHKGKIYYAAASDDLDNYYKWYTLEKVEYEYEYDGEIYTDYYFDYLRVTSELLILELDAYAIEAEVTSIDPMEYSPYTEMGRLFSASVTLNSEFEELHSINGVYWSISDGFGSRQMTQGQYDYLIQLLSYQSYEKYKDVDYTAALNLQSDYNSSNKPTYAVADTILNGLCAALNQAWLTAEANKPAPTDITSDQKIVLNKAIQNGQSIVDSNNPTDMLDGPAKDAAMAKWNALKAAIANAQSVLVKREPVATYTDAQEALAALNVTIAVYDETLQATEYNTITYSVPTDKGPFQVPYIMDRSGVWMGSVAPGNYTITAKIITDRGVLYECAKDVQIYDKAVGIKVNCAEEVAMNVGSKKALFSAIDFTYSLEPALPETIKSTTISTSNSDVLEWTENYNFKAKAAGTVTVYVTVESEQGNTYTTSFKVTVS